MANHSFRIKHESITLETLFESMPVALALIDRDGRHVALNQALASFSGLKASDLIGVKVEDLSEESGKNIKRDFEYFDAGMDVPDHEVQIRDRIYYVSVKPVRDSSGFAIGEMVALTDITNNKKIEMELEQANKKLKFMANHDPLTELLNARAYYEIANSLIRIAHRDGVNLSVLFIDLDHFKSINDRFGHDAGDAVLKAVSACLAANIRESDVVGRVGGEEFSICLPNTDQDGAMIITEKIRQKIEGLELNINNMMLRITTSIGVASNIGYYESINEIQKDADKAMYKAKSEGRNRVSCLNVGLSR